MLRSLLLAEHSKAQRDKIVHWIGEDSKRFDQLINLFLHDEDPKVIQRAAWPLSYAAIAHPKLVGKHLGKLLKNLEKPNIHEAVRRNTLRLLQDIPLPEKYHGIIMDTCFRLVTDPQQKPATKAFSLTILDKLSHIYPDIRPELLTIIDEQWDNESAAFRSRARKIQPFDQLRDRRRTVNR
ncbi:hypothetical protein [Terrimonas ferruginea]|uniref:hypothetical protein n=1 Tax=Terrimonas ferruginea TaxID=249 RepID=UPI000422F6DC|nr:hypothetical protein [Terrimonas ferruginea]